MDTARALLATLQARNYEGWNEERYNEIKGQGSRDIPQHLVEKYKHAGDSTSICGSMSENESIKSLQPPYTPLKERDEPSTTPQDTDRRLLALQKIYSSSSDKIQYCVVDDSFNHKLRIFYDKCEPAQVPHLPTFVVSRTC